MRNKLFMVIMSSIAITAVIGLLILIFIVVPASASNSDGLEISVLYDSFSHTIYEIVDKDTGVCYMYVSSVEKSGLTPMYQPNGMPKVKR